MKLCIVLLLVLFFAGPVNAVTVCVERITNGGFEPDLTGWNTYGGTTITSAAGYFHGGVNGADVYVDNGDYSNLSQSVDFTGATSMWFWFWSNGSATNTLNMTIGTSPSNVWNFSADETVWVHQEIDVSGITGAQKLQFNHTGTADNGSWVIDDVSIQYCTTTYPNVNPTTAGTTIIAALTLVGIMLIGSGALGLIYMFGSISGSIAGRQQSNMSTLTMGSVISIMLGAVLILITYAILSPLFTISGI